MAAGREGAVVVTRGRLLGVELARSWHSQNKILEITLDVKTGFVYTSAIKSNRRVKLFDHSRRKPGREVRRS